MERGLPLGRSASLEEIIESRMRKAVDQHLQCLVRRGEADRRNDTFRRTLLTELGLMMELAVPRTRTFSAVKVVRAYARLPLTSTA